MESSQSKRDQDGVSVSDRFGSVSDRIAQLDQQRRQRDQEMLNSNHDGGQNGQGGGQNNGGQKKIFGQTAYSVMSSALLGGDPNFSGRTNNTMGNNSARDASLSQTDRSERSGWNSQNRSKDSNFKADSNASEPSITIFSSMDLEKPSPDPAADPAATATPAGLSEPPGLFAMFGGIFGGILQLKMNEMIRN
jgi:hypothetical protein